MLLQGAAIALLVGGGGGGAGGRLLRAEARVPLDDGARPRHGRGGGAGGLVAAGRLGRRQAKICDAWCGRGLGSRGAVARTEDDWVRLRGRGGHRVAASRSLRGGGPRVGVLGHGGLRRPGVRH